jgi:hypothetical protein
MAEKLSWWDRRFRLSSRLKAGSWSMDIWEHLVGQPILAAAGFQPNVTCFFLPTFAETHEGLEKTKD